MRLLLQEYKEHLASLAGRSHARTRIRRDGWVTQWIGENTTSNTA
jgi:hypothetical protein